MCCHKLFLKYYFADGLKKKDEELQHQLILTDQVKQQLQAIQEEFS